MSTWVVVVSQLTRFEAQDGSQERSGTLESVIAILPPGHNHLFWVVGGGNHLPPLVPTDAHLWPGSPTSLHPN